MYREQRDKEKKNTTKSSNKGHEVSSEKEIIPQWEEKSEVVYQK